MAIPGATIEGAVFIVGAIALGWGLWDLPGRMANLRATALDVGDGCRFPFRDWAVPSAVLLGVSAVAAGVAGVVAEGVHGGPAGVWVAVGWVSAALATLGVGVGVALVGATGPKEVSEAELAELPRRAVGRLLAAGRTVAALCGGIAVLAFELILVESNLSQFALAGFLAGAAAGPVLLGLVGPKDRRSTRDEKGPAVGTKRPGAAASRTPFQAPAAASGLAFFSLLCIALAASTLFVERFPLGLFLFSNAVDLPLVLVAVGVGMSLSGWGACEALRPSTTTVSIRWIVGLSMAAGLIAGTWVIVTVGGAEVQLWFPVAMGALMTATLATWSLWRGSRHVSTVPDRRALRRALEGAASTALLTGILATGFVGSFLGAGGSGGASILFDVQLGWAGVVLTGVSLAAWAPTAAGLTAVAELHSQARAGAVLDRRDRQTSDPLPTSGSELDWPSSLGLGHGMIASAGAGVLTLVAMVYSIPGSFGSSPHSFFSSLAAGNARFLLGLAIGMAGTWAIVHPARLRGVVPVVRYSVAVGALLVTAALLGPVGLTGAAVGGLALATAVGAWATVRDTSPNRMGVATGDHGAFDSPSIELGRPSGRVEPSAALAGQWARVLPAAALVIVLVWTARGIFGGQ
ncbi:MAG: hypothetical protein L3J95_04860 [Thermoplasmata archaeon]|nr:hypothetical protein [Thermoplasmata archaeon]MCI4359735.1 hypothetical protein [Thermoplasmata archaeon]